MATHNCANYPIRAKYDNNPKSLIAVSGVGISASALVGRVTLTRLARRSEMHYE